MTFDVFSDTEVKGKLKVNKALVVHKVTGGDQDISLESNISVNGNQISPQEIGCLDGIESNIQSQIDLCWDREEILQ